MKIFIGADHGGFELKNELVQNLGVEGKYEIYDLGASEMNSEDDYPEYASLVANEVSQNEGSMGILICRSGIGMSIAANKFKGVYSALCFTEEHAKKAREHNNANVLCIDSDYQSNELLINIVKSFLNSSFEGWDSRHGRRVNQIKSIETENFK